MKHRALTSPLRQALLFFKLLKASTLINQKQGLQENVASKVSCEKRPSGDDKAVGMLGQELLGAPHILDSCKADELG